MDVSNSNSTLCAKWNSNVPLNIAIVIMWLWMIIGNGLLFLYMVSRWKKIWKPNLFLISLTISDLGTGIGPGSLYLIVSFMNVPQFVCHSYLGIGRMFARISSMTILIMSVDWVLKIKYPIKYRVEWSRTRIRIYVVAAVWILSIVLASINMIESALNGGDYTKGCMIRTKYTWWENWEPRMVINVSNVGSIIILIWVRILAREQVENTYKIAEIGSGKDEKGIEIELRRHRGGAPNFTTAEKVKKSKRNRIRSKFQKQPCHIRDPNQKHDMVFGSAVSNPSIVLGSMIVLNTFFVAAPTLAYGAFMASPLSEDKGILVSLVQFFPWIFWITSSVNPIIFAALNHSFRASVTRLIPFRKYVPATVSDQSSN